MNDTNRNNVPTSKATGNLKQTAYEVIKEKLICCEYAPNTILNESQLAADLNLSRTPVREALSLLEQEGYIQILPKKGILVTDITLNDVLQVFQARIELEPVALKLSADRIPVEQLVHYRDKLVAFDAVSHPIEAFALDTEMHMLFIDYCGNRFLTDMMHKVMDQNSRIVIASNQLSHHIHEAKFEHTQILQSLIDRKFDDAALQMRSHLMNCRQATIDYLCKSPLFAGARNEPAYNGYTLDFSRLHTLGGVQ